MLGLIKPLDIVLFDAEPNKLIHKPIVWRSLDLAVHCTIIKDSSGSMYDPDFKGVVISQPSDYKGRYYQILRYKKPFDEQLLLSWCESVLKTNTGYDYYQWFFGFVLGIFTTNLANSPNKWTCAELPYWMFQSNGYKLTAIEELLPMPRLFRYHNDFSTVHRGKL